MRAPLTYVRGSATSLHQHETSSSVHKRHGALLPECLGLLRRGPSAVLVPRSPAGTFGTLRSGLVWLSCLLLPQPLSPPTARTASWAASKRPNPRRVIGFPSQSGRPGSG